MKQAAITLICMLYLNIHAITQINLNYPKALVSIEDYSKLLDEIIEIRKNHLINLDQMISLQLEENTVVLDARSRALFEEKHINGAINLPFTEFTTENLRKIIPDVDTKIIIYCNNNFIGDPIYFASKTFDPKNKSFKTTYSKTSIRNQRLIKQALNIPTYISLYGYGYNNIYELYELVSINDTRLKLEGKSKK